MSMSNVCVAAKHSVRRAHGTAHARPSQVLPRNRTVHRKSGGHQSQDMKNVTGRRRRLQGPTCLNHVCCVEKGTLRQSRNCEDLLAGGHATGLRPKARRCQRRYSSERPKCSTLAMPPYRDQQSRAMRSKLEPSDAQQHAWPQRNQFCSPVGEQRAACVAVPTLARRASPHDFS